MPKALISLHGLSFDKPQSIENVEYTKEADLVHRLKQLQSGYSIDKKDRPKIKRLAVPSQKYPGKTRKIIDCTTAADWHYVAHINVTSPSVPTTTL